MAPLGPFAPGRDVAVAVSGGADSMALALLASRWGRAHALIVDHGMRPGSHHEAVLTADRLARLGTASTILRAGLAPGSAAAERARHARYRLLLQACRASGALDLLLAHHAGDQAETVRMRKDAGSLSAGLAGMASILYREEARLLRPLLTIPPSRLRATLRAAAVDWVEDPTNRDPRTLRARLRATMAPAAIADALAIGRRHGAERAEAERDLARELAAVQFHPAGFALISGPMSENALSAVIWAISGQDYPPPRTTLSAGLSSRSAHGVLLRPAGRLGPFTLVAREPDAVDPPIDVAPDLRWDGRFRISAAPGLATMTIGALGSQAANFGRRSGLPSIIRRSLPALRSNGEIVAVPHLGFHNRSSCLSLSIVFSPPRPAVGTPFVNPSASEGM